jgi:hypothetical protein
MKFVCFYSDGRNSQKRSSAGTMKLTVALCIILSIVSSLPAQIMDISGRVADEKAVALSGVAIKLLNAGRAVVSDANGMYRITSSSVKNPGLLASAAIADDAARIVGNRLVLTVGLNQRVSVDAFTISGRKAARIFNARVAEGTCAIPLPSLLFSGHAYSITLLVTAIGSKRFVQKIVTGADAIGATASGGSAADRAGFSKVGADTIADTLMLAKTGFDTVRICIPKYVDRIPVVRMTSTTGYPRLVLNNDSMFLTIYKPDAVKGYCRGPRFDWSGIIGRVEYKGHAWYADYAVPHDPLQEPCGTAGEYGIETPVGYNGTDDFVKIGVGRLKGTGGTYDFRTLYTIVDPGVWNIVRGKNWLEFTHLLAAVNGYDYDYVKRITLPDGEAVYTIDYYLKNTGTKAIATDHYTHNFTMIDDKTVAGNYRVTFGFPPTLQSQTASGPGWGGGTTISGKVITIKGTLSGGDFLWATFGGLSNNVSDNSAVVEETGGKAALKIQGDWAPYKYNFWASPRSVCPEPYLTVNLSPGSVLKWRDTYTPYPNGVP